MNDWMVAIATLLTANGWIAFGAAFVWGIMSVIFSPCHLASVPLLIAYIGGAVEDKGFKNTFVYSLLFSAGLFLTIAVVGVITSIAGRMLGDIGRGFNVFIGIVIIVLGLFIAGWIPLSLPALGQMKPGKKGALGAFLLGSTYGVVSGPCTFGFIAPMLAMTAVSDTFQRGAGLIVLFAAGHCLPIMLGGMSTSFVQNLVSSDRMNSLGNVVKKVAGIVFILIGLYLITR